MAYDQVSLLENIRTRYLPNTSEEDLPEKVIFLIADSIDANPSYTGKQNYITYYTTLQCLDYLIARSTIQTGVSGNKDKNTRKEKSGDWEITVTQENSSEDGTVGIAGYKALKSLYSDQPEMFGITASETLQSTIIFGGNSDKERDAINSDPDKLTWEDEWDWLDKAEEYKHNLKI